MSTYRLSEEGKQRVRIDLLRLLFLIFLPLCLILLIPGLVIMYQQEHTILSPAFIEFISIFLGIIVVVMFFKGKSILKTFQSLQFTIYR